MGCYAAQGIQQRVASYGAVGDAGVAGISVELAGAVIAARDAVWRGRKRDWMPGEVAWWARSA